MSNGDGAKGWGSCAFCRETGRSLERMRGNLDSSPPVPEVLRFRDRPDGLLGEPSPPCEGWVGSIATCARSGPSFLTRGADACRVAARDKD